MSNNNPNTPAPVALQKKERKKLIIKQVNIHTRLMFTDLVKLIDVSEDTIRRDVNELAEEGQVIRIKGALCRPPTILVMNHKPIRSNIKRSLPIKPCSC